MQHLLSHTLHHDEDVVICRQRAARLSALLGFDVMDQTRIATAVSEIVRNAFRYAGRSTVEFHVDGDLRPQHLVIEVRDRGRGIPHLDDVLAGRYQSTTGMGTGIVNARRLMDRFAIESSPEGTLAVLVKFLPAHAEFVTPDRARQISDSLRHRRPDGLLEELQHHNQELLRALDEVQRRQQELVQLNRELEDTNRGVVALYAELDEKAEHLRRADELKSRFLSNMSHEFRTPVNSIIGLCDLLIDDAAREEREAGGEVLHIRQAAEQLADLVNDLLDLAKVEAGKTLVRPSAVDIRTLFGALRGMMRPLLVSQSLALTFDDGEGLPPLHTDEAKVSQILRNLISNALKFTERGEVRVSARLDDRGDTISFEVADTGIGIAPEDQQRIFEEFAQVEHRLQRVVRGTGLGLPLSRRLAELLGGSLTVDSEPGVGSTFTLTVPLRYAPPGETGERLFEDAQPAEVTPEAPLADGRRADALPLRVLIVDDQEIARYLMRQYLPPPDYEVSEVASGQEALRRATAGVPDVIVLDLVMPGMSGLDVLERLRNDPATVNIPVVIATATTVEPAAERRLHAQGAAVLSKSGLNREALDAAVRSAVLRNRRERETS